MPSWLRSLAKVPPSYGAGSTGAASNGGSPNGLTPGGVAANGATSHEWSPHLAATNGGAAFDAPARDAEAGHPRAASSVRTFPAHGEARSALPDGRVDSGARALPEGDDGNGAASGVHAITRTTNYWFEREVHDVEREAERAAVEWAQKGLPRHDVPRTEPLEPEQVLAKRCAQLLHEWQIRVRTKMQDAIEDAGRQLGEHVATLRARTARLEAIAHELAERERRIERVRRETEQDERPVRYDRLIPGWGFWLGALALGAVEFMANFPVFRLLLPMNAALARVASGIADTVDPESLGAGARMLLAEWATHIEAVVVTLVAVIVLVVLGKFVGRSSRPWFALRPADHPTAARTIRAHRREHAFKVVASALGVACVLAFLYQARGDIAALAGERVRHDREAVAAAESRLAEAQARRDDAGIVRANTELLQLRDVLLQHEEDERYASTVQRNNEPILLLNLALVITAAVLGYAAARADLGDKRGEHPDLVRLRERCVELHGEQIAVDHDARAAAAQAHMAASRVRHLLGAQPLRDWEPKVHRLQSVIPRFRGENARVRGLDPANVRAFDEPPRLELPAVDERMRLAEPAEFVRLRDELQELTLALARLAPRTLPREPAATRADAPHTAVAL